VGSKPLTPFNEGGGPAAGENVVTTGTFVTVGLLDEALCNHEMPPKPIVPAGTHYGGNGTSICQNDSRPHFQAAFDSCKALLTHD
jgi:hypothetical protein